MDASPYRNEKSYLTKMINMSTFIDQYITIARINIFENLFLAIYYSRATFASFAGSDLSLAMSS